MIILMMKEILLEILLYNKGNYFMKIDQINSLISIRNFMLSSANEMSNLPKDKRNQAISKVKEISSIMLEHFLVLKLPFVSVLPCIGSQTKRQLIFALVIDSKSSYK